MTARLIRCLLLLSLVLYQHCQAETVSVTASFNTNGKTYNDFIYDLTGLNGKSGTTVGSISSPIVTGTGVYFKGFSSYDSSTGAAVLKLNVTDATVTNAPIKISGFFPPGSNTNISGTKASMLGDSILFDFRTLVPKDNVMVFVFNTVAEWTSAPGGVVLALGDEKVRVLIEMKSGLYLLHVNATGAMNMVRFYGDACEAKYCLDVYNGLFAVDFANCTKCNGAFFNAGVQMIANSKNGMTRFQNCTHQTGQDQPFYYANSASYLFVFGTDGNFVMSSITTDGDLFSVPNQQVSKCLPTSQMVFQHIKAKAHGLGFFFFAELYGTCEVYVGNLTFGNDTLTEPSQFEAIMVAYSKIVDDFGKIVYDARDAGDSKIPGECSLVYCVRSSYTSATPEIMPTDAQNQEVVANGFPPVEQWTRSNCVCKEGTFPPYCTDVFDPLLYPVGYSFEVRECETDPVSCKQCRWGEWDTCGECNPGYKLNNAQVCIPKGCSVDHCQTCVFDDEYTCQTCKDNYKVSGADCVEKTCAKLPSTGCKTVSGNEDISAGCISPHQLNPSTQQCDACIDHYKLDGDSCIEKTCAKAPCTGCDNPSGNTDTCKSCPSPFSVNPLTQQCDACIDNYKLDGESCVKKTCAKPPSTGCNTVSGNEDISVGCTSPHQLNPSTQQCDACVDNYKLEDDTCIEKTCAKPPSTGCNSVSGNEDISVGCTSPHQLNPSSQQCDACIDNYKLVGSDCVQKTCAKGPCTGCNTVSGDEDICLGCTTPHKMNSSTQQCDACIDNYKLDGDTCIEKTCAKPPSTGCNSVSGNEDISVGCTTPHVLNSSTQQCDACEPGLKYIQENGTCVEKHCLVANCSKCVFDQEYQCDSCGDGLQLNGDLQCGAKSDDKKVSTGMLIGIIIAIAAVVVIAALLIFFLCCRRERTSYEAVEHLEMKNMPAVKGNNLPSVEVEEETEVTIMNPEGEGDERNPLLPTKEANEPPTVSGGRRARRARNVRRAQAEVADIDLDGMYSKDNEIEEEIF